MTDTVDGPISLSDYAKHRGCSREAVSKAIRRRRLIRSVVRVDGRPKIRDIALADQEWEQNVGRTTRSARPSPPTDGTASGEPSAGESTLQDVIHPGEPISASTLFEAQRIATLERARKLRLENDVTEGRLVAVEAASKEAFEAARIIRESVLNVPARLAGELASEGIEGGAIARVHARLDKALRDALSGTADALLVAANG